MRSFVIILLSSFIGVSLFASNTTAITTSAASELVDPPRPPRIIYPATICPGESTTIDFVLVEKESDATYTWILTPALQAIASESADKCTLTVNDISSVNSLLDIVVVRAQNSCGQNFSSAPVRIVTPLDIPEIELDTICTGDGMLISPLKTTRVRSYTWDFGPATDWEVADGSLEEGDPFSVRFNSQGLKTFSVSITDSDGCTHSKSYQVQVYNAPPSPFIQCKDGDAVVEYEWDENPAFRYEYDFSLMRPELTVTKIPGENRVEVVGFRSPCDYAILKIIVYGDNPTPCDSIAESLPCRPSPKPSASFDFRQKDFCVGDVLSEMPLLATITPQGGTSEQNPSDGEWTFDGPPAGTQTGPDPGFTFSDPGPDSGRNGTFDPRGLPVGDYSAVYIYTNPVDGCEEPNQFSFTVHPRAVPNATLNGTIDKAAEICGGESVTLHYSIYDDAPPPNIQVQTEEGGVIVESLTDSTKLITFPNTFDNVTETLTILVQYELPDCEPVAETLTVTVNQIPDLELQCSDIPLANEIDIEWTDIGVPVDILVNGNDRGQAMGGTHKIDALETNRIYDIVLVAQPLGNCGEIRDTITCMTTNCLSPTIDSTSLATPFCGDGVSGQSLDIFISGPGVYTWDAATLANMEDDTPGAEIFKPFDPLISEYTLTATYNDALGGCTEQIEMSLVYYTMPEAFLALDADTVCVDQIVNFQSNNIVNSSNTDYGLDLPPAANQISGENAGPYELSFDIPGSYELGMQLTLGGTCQGLPESLPLEVVAPMELNAVCRRQGEDAITIGWDDLGLEYTVMQDAAPVGGTITADSLELTGLAENQTFMFTVTATDPYCGEITSEATCVTFACTDPIVVDNIQDTICFDPLQGAYFLDVMVEADVANGGAPGTFTWDSPLVDAANNFTPDNAQDVEYKVDGTWSDDDGCFKAIAFDFILVQTPEMVLNVVGLDTICEGNETITVVGEFIGANVDETEFVPQFPTGVTIEDNPQEGTYILSFDEAGDYDLGMLVSYYGCPGNPAEVKVHIKEKPELGLKCGTVENEAVNLEWNDLGAAAYEIKQNGIIQQPATGTTLRIDGLTMNEVYEYIVETITDCGLISDTIKCQTFVCPAAVVDLTGVPDEICHDSSTGPFELDVILESLDPADNGTYTWDTDLVDADDGFTPEDLTLTDYTLDIEYTDDNGCDEDHQVSFTYTESPQPMVILTSLDTICIDGGTVSIMSEYTAADMSLVSFTAEEPAGATIVGGTGAGPYEYSFTQPGTYQLGISVDNDGCSSGDAGYVEVVVQPAIEQTVVSCQEDFGVIHLDWTPLNCVSTYKVYLDGEFVKNVSGLATTIPDTTEADFEYLESDTEFDIIIEPVSNCLCEASVTTISCRTLPCPPVLISTVEVDTCFNTTLPAFEIPVEVMTSGEIAGGSGKWSGDIISSDGLVDPSILNGPGVYDVTYTWVEIGCVTKLDTKVTFHAPPIIDLEALSPECIGDELGMVIVSVEGGSPDFSFSLSGEEAQSDSIFSAVPIGPFFVEVTDGNGCLVSMDDNVQPSIEPSMQILGDTVIVEANDAIFELILDNLDTDRIKNITWYLNGENVCEGLNCTELELQDVVAPGEITVELDYGTDCLIIRDKAFRINEIQSVYIPDMVDFSGALGAPDNEWKAFIKGSETFITSVQVFDRWGNMVRDYENKSMDYFKEFLIWDGFSGSVAREQGVYTYVIGLLIEGETETKYGNVTILR